VSHNFCAHFIHPTFNYYLPWYLIKFLVCLKMGFNLLRSDTWILLHLVLNNFFNTHLRVVSEIIPFVAVNIGMFIQVAILTIVQIYQHLTGTEYLTFPVDVETIFDHTLKYSVHSVFKVVLGSLLKNAREIVVTSFDHIVHFIIKLYSVTILDFILLLIDLVILLGIKHA